MSRSARLRTCERGNIALFALGFLPVVAALAFLAIEVGRRGARSSMLQDVADSIALETAQVVPDQEKAAALSAHFNDLYSAQGIRVAIQAFGANGRHVVRVEVTEPSRGGFGYGEGKNVTRSAEAEIVPSDTVVIMHDGGSLRPSSSGTLSADSRSYASSWGNEIDWPASRLLQCVGYPGYGAPELPWAETWFRRWLTQGCFNPSWSALKRAVILYSGALRRTNLHRFGLIFSPGDLSGREYQVRKPLQPLTAATDAVEAGRPLNELQPPDPYSQLTDALCAAMADSRFVMDTRFSKPDLAGVAADERTRDSSPALNQSPCGRSYGPHLAEVLGDTFDNAVYFHRAVPQPSAFVHPQFGPAVLGARKMLKGVLSTGAEGGGSGPVVSRRRRIVIFTDVITDERAGDGTALLEQIGGALKDGIEVDIVVFNHEFVSNALRDSNEAQVAELSQLAKAEEGRALRVWAPGDERELVNQVIPSLYKDSTAVVLRR